MKLNRTTWMAAVLGTVAVTGMVGCGKAPNGQGQGAATVTVHQQALTDITKVTVSVSGTLEGVSLASIPLVGNLPGVSSTQYSAVISDLPITTVGSCDYVFTATATDSTNTVIYTGVSDHQCITKNQTANIIIDMADQKPHQTINDEAPFIDALTDTAACVSINDTVTIKATMHDIDVGDTAGMTWAWSVASCGQIVAGSQIDTAGTDTINATSQITFKALANSTGCQVNLVVNDKRMPTTLQTKAAVAIVIGDSCAYGLAKITAVPDTCPAVTGVSTSASPLVDGVPTTLSVAASDSDGDTLNYNWTADCTNYGYGYFVSGGTTSTTATGNPVSFVYTGPGNLPTAVDCIFNVTVDDGKWTSGQLAEQTKCSVVSNLSVPGTAAGYKQQDSCKWSYDYLSSNSVGDGDVVTLEIAAPCNAPVWSAGTAIPAASLTAPFTTGVTFTTPANSISNGALVTVTCGTGDTACSHSFQMVGKAAFCATASDGADCTSSAQLTNKCVQSAICTTGQCVAQSTVTCSPSTTACQVNTCNTGTGVCGLVAGPDGNACSDGLACNGTTDKCSAGTCLPTGTPVTCTATGNPCTQNTCQEPNGTCVVSNMANGTLCSDSNGCTGVSTPVTGSDPGTSSATADACLAGVCTAGPAVTCASQTDVCTSVTASTFSCGAKQCDVFAWAQMLIPPLGGLGISTTGTPWITGSLYTPFNFGTGTVSSTGNADMYLAKIDPATGLATSTFLFGDKNSSAQVGSGVAVASGGNVGVMGTFSGEIDFTANNSDGSGASGGVGVAGLDLLQNAGSISFYAVFDGSGTADTYGAPTTVKEHMVDIGTGALLSMASNPSQNLIAYCGKTSKLVPAWNVAGATKGVLTAAGGGGNTAFGGGNYDLVVFVVDASTGVVKWGKQYGGAGDQVCESVAIDNTGNVMIAGTFFGSLFSMTAPGGGDVSGGTSALFMAKLNAADGTLGSAQTWTVPVGSVSHAYGLTVDLTGNIIMGGSIGSAYNFGTGAVAYAGLNDAFVAKFNSSMVAQWAKADGDASQDQIVKSVATDSAGNITLVGSFKGSLPAFGLTDSSNAALDAFQVALSADGTVLDCAHSYGDAAGAQAMSQVAIASSATAGLKNAVFVAGADSGRMVLNTLTGLAIDTGNPSTAYSFFARAAENF